MNIHEYSNTYINVASLILKKKDVIYYSFITYLILKTCKFVDKNKGEIILKFACFLEKKICIHWFLTCLKYIKFIKDVVGCQSIIEAYIHTRRSASVSGRTTGKMFRAHSVEIWTPSSHCGLFVKGITVAHIWKQFILWSYKSVAQIFRWELPTMHLWLAVKTPTTTLRVSRSPPLFMRCHVDSPPLQKHTEL